MQFPTALSAPWFRVESEGDDVRRLRLSLLGWLLEASSTSGAQSTSKQLVQANLIAAHPHERVHNISENYKV